MRSFTFLLSSLISVLLLFIAPLAAAAQCVSNPSFSPDTDDSSWSGWGGNYENTRFNDSASNPIDANELSNLELKWAFAFPDAGSVIGNPALSGGRIFIGSENGEVYSLDAESGCTVSITGSDV